MAKDPICGMEVNEGQAPASWVYRDQKFYFCAESCYETFRRNPDRYLAGERKQGWIGRFLNRLAKANQEAYANKPPTCH